MSTSASRVPEVRLIAQGEQVAQRIEDEFRVAADADLDPSCSHARPLLICAIMDYGKYVRGRAEGGAETNSSTVVKEQSCD